MVGEEDQQVVMGLVREVVATGGMGVVKVEERSKGVEARGVAEVEVVGTGVVVVVDIRVVVEDTGVQ